MSVARQVAVVGAGWAGCAAAVELARAGCKVTLYESARSLGGRARGVAINNMTLDNGQHIMLGAYSETLRLMRIAGVDAERSFLRLPLQMRYPDNGKGMDFLAPRLPAPLHLGLALWRAKGLSRADKMALARFSTTARWMGWTLYEDCSVSELLERFEQTPRLVQLMWRPLCLAALNTPPDQASAKVFLAVLRDSLGAKRAASDMLLPRVDLGSAFPDAAARYIEGKEGVVRSGAKVTRVHRTQTGWQVDASGAAVGGHWNAHFDAVVLATPAAVTADLLAHEAGGRPGAATTPQAIAAAWDAAQDLAARRAEPDDPAPGASALLAIVAQLDALRYEAITTVYLQYHAELRLAQPFFALVDNAEIGHWGQFVFDRGQLDAANAGLMSVVISASGAAAELGQEALAVLVASQLADELGNPAFGSPLWTRVITEKRATWACVPNLSRPSNDSGLDGLALAGDYTSNDYPATLEGAVRSGAAAAKLVSRPPKRRF